MPKTILGLIGVLIFSIVLWVGLSVGIFACVGYMNGYKITAVKCSPLKK